MRWCPGTARAAAWIWVALNAAYVLVAVQFMHRRILQGDKRLWHLEDVVLPVGCAVGAALLLTPFAPGDMTSRLRWVMFLACAAIVTATGAVVGARRIRAIARAFIRVGLGT